MTNKRRSPLRMADGGIVPVRAVSPYSFRGIGRALASGYGSAVDHTAGAMEGLQHTFGRPIGYQPDPVQPAPVPMQPMQPAPVQPMPGAGLGNLSDYSGMGAMQRREAALGLRDGGIVHGPGGPTDDRVPAMLSPGESVLPADTTAAVGKENVKALIRRTHKPVHGKGVRHFANGIAGIDVDESPFTDSDARLFGQRPAGTVPGSSSMPGVEVHEPFAGGAARAGGPAPSIPGMRVEYPITDPGPGNPNVGRAARPMPMPTPVAPGAPAAATGLRAGLQRLAPVAEAGSSLLKGSAYTAVPVAAANTYGTDTEDYAKRFGMQDTEPGVMRDLGIRTLGFASDLGNALTFNQAGRFFRDKQQPDAAPVAPNASAAPAAPGTGMPTDTGTPTDSRLATLDQGSPGMLPPSQVPDLSNPTGMKEMGDGIRKFNTADGRTLYSNVNGFDSNDKLMSGQGGNVSVLPSGAGPSLDASTDARLSAARQAAAARGDFDSVRASYGASGGGQPQGLRARLEEQLAGKTLNRNGVDALARAEELDNQRASNGLRAQLEMRGQDITARGQDLTAGTARARARMDQFNSDRNYQLDVQKYGTDVAEKNRAARSAADESFTKQLQTRFQTTGPDGKATPDNQKVAEFSTALGATMPRMIEQLEATGTPAAQKKAQELRQRGAAALEPGDVDAMQQLFDRRERMRQSRGAGPNQGTFSHSDNLLDYRQLPGAAGVDKRTFGGNRIVTPAGSASINDLSYEDGPANALLPDLFKVRNRNLTRGLRAE